MPGQHSIEVIQFGPNPLADETHPNEVSLTLEDAMEMVEATYGSDINVEVVQDPVNPECGKILLDPLVILSQKRKHTHQLPYPVKTRPEYHALTGKLIGETYRSSFIGNAHTYFEHR